LSSFRPINDDHERMPRADVENGSVAAGRSPLLVSVEFQKIY
jgi:hypothetical protein